MAADNIAVVSTSMIPTVLIKESGVSIVKSNYTEKGFSLPPSSVTTDNLIHSFTNQEPQMVFVENTINHWEILIPSVSFDVSDTKSDWSLFSSRSTFVREEIQKYPTLQINTIMKETAIRESEFVGSNIVYKDKSYLVRENKKSEIFQFLNPLTVQVKDDNDNFIFDSAFVMVNDDTNTVGFFNDAKLSTTSVLIEDSRPLNIGGQPIGGGLKSIVIVAQKMSFFEMALSFTEGRVVNVSALPMGMYYEQGKIKGSPMASGYYPITIHLDTGSMIEGVITVPHVPRQL